jgi:hypothetical protein
MRPDGRAAEHGFGGWIYPEGTTIVRHDDNRVGQAVDNIAPEIHYRLYGLGRSGLGCLTNLSQRPRSTKSCLETKGKWGEF